jgi:hypothetical protein
MIVQCRQWVINVDLIHLSSARLHTTLIEKPLPPLVHDLPNSPSTWS